MATDETTFTVTGGDSEDEFTVPDALLDLLSEPGDDPATVVADVATMAFASRAHAIAHHTEGETDEEIAAMEERALDIFEDRFGMTYGEATGHQH